VIVKSQKELTPCIITKFVFGVTSVYVIFRRIDRNCGWRCCWDSNPSP